MRVMIKSPKKRLIKLPVTKKGPKGIVSLMDAFFLHRISMRPINAPVKKAKYKESSIFGKPKINPKRKASFTSPKPIPLPPVKINKIRKNKKAPTADTKFKIKN